MNTTSLGASSRSILILDRIDLKVSWLAFATFVCGVAGGRALNFIGEFYLGELLIIQLALFVLLFGRDRSLLDISDFGVFVQTAVLMLAGYIISDIYRETNPGQFLRGWARVILLALDFIAFAIVIARDRRALWWFVLGLGVGQIGQLLVRHVPMMSAPGWKFGYATPLAYLLACLSYFLPVKIACLLFAGLGVWNIFMDFRIMGAICLLIAAVLWVRSSNPDGLSGMQLLKLFSACLIAAAVVGAALYATSDEFGKRREGSNIGREAGLIVALHGVVESPIIGYGSWPTDPRLVSLFENQVAEEGGDRGESASVQVFTAHSQALQAWVEGGVLAVVFFFYYGMRLFACGFWVGLKRRPDGHLPVLLLFLSYNAWSLFMSPFSGATRVPLALGVAMICMCALERHEARSQAQVRAHVQGAVAAAP
jgi:hypothetical protein